MHREFPRSHRVADQIQRELANILRTELKDPRVDTLVTVAGVAVSKDLSHATVYITLLDSGHAGETIRALNHAAGFLRSELASRMRLRGVPELRFRYDESPERGARLSALIDDAVRSDQRPEADDDA